MTPRQTITPFSVFRRVQAPQRSKLGFTPLPSSIILTLTLQLKRPNQLENRQPTNRKKAQRTTNRLRKSQLLTMCFLMGRREKLTIVNGLDSSQPALARIKPMVAMRNKKKTLSPMIPKRAVLADNGNNKEIKRRMHPSLTHITTTAVAEVVRITMVRATTEPQRLTNQSLVASAVCSSS